MAPVTYYAGQNFTAAYLNSALPILGYCTADTSKTSNTTLGNITGLSVPVAASTTYALDGYLGYDGNATGDIKFAFTQPSGTTGHWGLAGDDTTTSGNLKTTTAAALTTVITLGGGTAKATVHGYVVVAGTAGTLQLQFAQNTSNGTATTVRAGSWIRLSKIA